MKTAKLHPVQLEIPYQTRAGRPSYKRVEGYQIEDPSGALLYPYERKANAKAFCKAQGWKWVVV